MTTLTIEHYPFSSINMDKYLLKWVIDRFKILTLSERAPAFEPSRLDTLAAEQGIEEPTDLNAIWGSLEGAIDDEFLQALRQQREHHL